MAFSISSQQMADGYVGTDETYAEWYIEEVMRSHQPDMYHALTPQGRIDRVLRGRELARQHGLTHPEAQAYFIAMMFDIGPDFYRFDGFSDALARTDLDEVTRARQFLDGTVTDAQAVHAITHSSEKYWWDESEGPYG